ncbi:hypothetical protein RvY_13025 [Ramazzottius varieornatus]|uniref:Uncharacterized protein n=1 Tax=Ramazzottius varieornatus TaxID=947166 RepID=A0A1D1VLG6_RAMVA|nr:hypothetical protein RvY_13025 [Ramazzottius varieornatus]
MKNWRNAKDYLFDRVGNSYETTDGMLANLPNADEYGSHELMHLPPAPRRSRDREDFLIRKENILNVHVEQSIPSCEDFQNITVEISERQKYNSPGDSVIYCLNHK